MSTRCLISKLNKDETIRAIYCHHDGYVAGGVGEILISCYKNPVKINALLDLGDLSALGCEPKTDKEYWSNHLNTNYKRSNDSCASYRDRGETGTDATTYSNIFDLLSELSAVDYIYLFDGDEWLVAGVVDRHFVPVTDVLDGSFDELDL